MAAVNAAVLPLGFKFGPDDDVLVAHYLLPRLRGQRLPFDGVFIEDDPLSAPPWKLLGKYERKDAFFFAAGQAMSGNGSRQKRACAGGGCWVVQKKPVDGEKLRLRVPADAGMDITWRKYVLNFHAHGESGSTGWVMDEYAVTAPPDLASSSLMAYHIRLSGHGKKRDREPHPHDSVDADAGAHSMAETTPPPLDEHPLAPQPITPTPAVVVIDPEATLPDQGSSGVTDSSSFLDLQFLEPLFSLDDFISPATVDSAGGVAVSTQHY